MIYFLTLFVICIDPHVPLTFVRWGTLTPPQFLWWWRPCSRHRRHVMAIAELEMQLQLSANKEHKMFCFKFQTYLQRIHNTIHNEPHAFVMLWFKTRHTAQIIDVTPYQQSCIVMTLQ